MLPEALVTVPKRRFLSPLRHRSLWGRKVWLRGWSKSQILSTEVGNPTSLHPKSDWAWCGPGASILRWQQDCPSHSCATHRIALMHYQQLGLGAVLARAQPCDGAGPAVELPGFRHVVYAQKKGRPLAKSASRSSEWSARWPLQTPHAAQRQWPLLCEGVPLSREAVAQQDVRAGSRRPSLGDYQRDTARTGSDQCSATQGSVFSAARSVRVAERLVHLKLLTLGYSVRVVAMHRSHVSQ